MYRNAGDSVGSLRKGALNSLFGEWISRALISGAMSVFGNCGVPRERTGTSFHPFQSRRESGNF